MNAQNEGRFEIGNAPCSWGVIENTAGERYEYDQVLDEIAKAGYAGTELGDLGFMPTDPDRLRAELAERNLQLMAGWSTVRLYDVAYHDAGLADALAVAKILVAVGGPDSMLVIGPDHSTVDLRHANAGRTTADMMLDEAGWEIYRDGVHKVARAVRDETGLRSVFHPHGASYVENSAEIDHFLSITDPELVGLVFDTGHYELGGGDAAAAVHKYADRIWHVHFKDFDPSIVVKAVANGWGYQQMIAHGVFSELGTGIVAFPAVRDALIAIDYDGWIIVEQDMLKGMGAPFESNLRNRQYLQSIGL